MKGKKVFISALIVAGVAILSIAIAITAFFIYFTHSNEIDNRSPSAQADMLKTTLEWGRLAPIPDSKTEFNIYTDGGSFTRAFHSSFYLPQTDLKKWIADSPGLADAEIQVINDTNKNYIIKAGGGAQHAEAAIDFSSGFVKIYVYWS